MVQRIEVITGKERRRRWSAEEKARLVVETLKPGAVISHVARRNRVAESCLYAWRRQAAQGLAGRRAPEEASAVLIPVAVDPGETGEPAEPGRLYAVEGHAAGDPESGLTGVRWALTPQPLEHA